MNSPFLGLFFRLNEVLVSSIIEDIHNCIVKRGFIYLIPKEDAVVFDLNNDLKTNAKNLLDEIQRMISDQQIPLPVNSKEKCSDCEYRNFCGDVF